MFIYPTLEERGTSAERMAECRCINLTAKTFFLQSDFNSSRFRSSSSLLSANRTIVSKTFKLSASSMEAQPRHSFEALTSIDPKNHLMNAIKASVSSCLSETHLHLTVPGLQSMTRGKVNPLFCILNGPDLLRN